MAEDIETQLKAFNNRLQKLNEGITLMKRFGLNEDILIAYLCHNLHISKKDAQNIINCYEGFYEKIVKKGIIGKLKE